DLKYAVLHLASGTELVLKERLRRENPALLYQRPEKFDEADFDAGNFSSANAKEAVKRLVDDAGVTVSDRHRNQLHLLREMRNRIGHFGMNDTEEAVLATTARGLAFAVD